ncbi:hypothetical protein [Brevibacillus laterosporus]|uniref:hypothetical protein n=1 Tax=Brevibacillus laterosporus TaxID=1465 RepID=UPI00215BFD2E|nr:hypothetical protein [Brevibacillus laterosporus]MCR8994608.1 hypothetical protein [Brevibacillus laterosporus]
MNGIIEYNQVIEGSGDPIEMNSKTYEGFYISYNTYDRVYYGCDTTALVLGQMQKFFILNGDHRKQYAELIKQGFHACLAYYKANIENANKFSDRIAN